MTGQGMSIQLAAALALTKGVSVALLPMNILLRAPHGQAASHPVWVRADGQSGRLLG